MTTSGKTSFGDYLHVLWIKPSFFVLRDHTRLCFSFVSFWHRILYSFMIFNIGKQDELRLIGYVMLK
uniref:Uncharacterized protein n=1 Tax=uncultured marine thaumarchaeote KM3_136_D12 TaxID=1456005 RepID=A0A075GAI9_9ARCH|nr:hypothetical protein [uncultured marine thaumarchaeote KM3_136_D12]